MFDMQAMLMDLSDTCYDQQLVFVCRSAEAKCALSLWPSFPRAVGVPREAVRARWGRRRGLGSALCDKATKP